MPVPGMGVGIGNVARPCAFVIASPLPVWTVMPETGLPLS